MRVPISLVMVIPPYTNPSLMAFTTAMLLVLTPSFSLMCLMTFTGGSFAGGEAAVRAPRGTAGDVPRRRASL